MTEEGKLQNKIIKYAESKGVLVIKHIVCNKNGFPDLQLFFPSGLMVLIECKSPSGVLSEEQKGMIKNLSDHNQGVEIVDSYFDAKHYIDLGFTIPYVC